MKYALIYSNFDILIDVAADFLSKIYAIYTDDVSSVGKSYGNIPIKSFDDLENNTFYFILDDQKYSIARNMLLDKGLHEFNDFMRLYDFYGNDSLPSPYENRSWNFYDSYVNYEIPVFNIRSNVAASYIPKGCESLLDLGAGSEVMKLAISPFTDYVPVDYLKRTESTVVCDFNKHEFPLGVYDTIMAIGILQYVSDCEWFLKSCTEACKNRIILSYVSLEANMSPRLRHKRGIVNNLTIGQIVSLFIENGFIFVDEIVLNSDVVLVFDRKGVNYEKEI